MNFFLFSVLKQRMIQWGMLYGVSTLRCLPCSKTRDHNSSSAHCMHSESLDVHPEYRLMQHVSIQPALHILYNLELKPHPHRKQSQSPSAVYSYLNTSNWDPLFGGKGLGLGLSSRIFCMLHWISRTTVLWYIEKCFMEIPFIWSWPDPEGPCPPPPPSCCKVPQILTKCPHGSPLAATILLTANWNAQHPQEMCPQMSSAPLPRFFCISPWI